MNIKFKQFFALLFMVLLSLSGSFTYSVVNKESKSENMSQNSLQNDIVFHSMRFGRRAFTNLSIIITGYIIDYINLSFINCNIIFLDNNSLLEYPHIFVDKFGRLSFINSNITYLSADNAVKSYSLFEGHENSTIILQNSIFRASSPAPLLVNVSNSEIVSVSNSSFYNFSNIFFSNSTYNVDIFNSSFSASTEFFPLKANLNPIYSPYYMFIALNTSVLNVTDNSFTNIPNLFYYDSYISLNLYGNNFTNFSNVIYFQHAIDSLITQNNFINGTNPFLISTVNSFGTMNAKVNNFIAIHDIIKFDSVTEPSINNNFVFSYNYYSNFSTLYVSGSGYYEKPYYNTYFVDFFPLVKPFQDYSNINSELFLKTNSFYNLSLSSSKITLINFHWFLIILFYGSILLFPVILISVPKLAKLKKGTKRKHLKKTFESID